ncbi:nucleoside recognition domain-containing protein, partial [Anaerotruncus massiliensis (ex Liu et al. 2021)]|uniref:nucleoside recognition domain-containing protein n=2 Tax=Anaerotruncus TaxID=244127 RepID=UPI003AB163EC
VKTPPRPAGGTLTDRIDGAVLHRKLAFPIFLAAMAGMFGVCFGGPGLALKGWMERLLAGLSAGLSGWLPALGVSPPVSDLLVGGVLGGVGSVLTFLPQVALIFLCLTLLEECGYLSRAAFLMDLPLRRLGLTGKSFIPMLMGFGCTTPAVMAARTLGGERDRRLTILLTPYLPCSARFPIYALFAGVFFPRRQGLAVAALYLAGIAAMAAVGWFLRKGPFRGREAPFLMEFPPYRAPSLRNVLRNTGEKCGDFLRKAGTLIFAMSVLIWLLQHVDGGLRFTADPAASLFARAGGALAPLFSPLGFGFREAAVALLAGLVSKEAVVSTLGVSLAGEGPLAAALAARFSPLSAAAFLVFCALYAPCVSALATMRRELHSTWRALAAALLQTAVAYAAALAVFQLGTLAQNLVGLL